MAIAGAVRLASAGSAHAQPSKATASDDGVVTGAVEWNGHRGSLAAERAWARRQLSALRFPTQADKAAAGNAGLFHSTRVVRAGRRVRPWYSYSPATYHVNRSLPGSRLEGLVYSEWKGKYYGCSGTVVNSPNGSVVWTAGHCIFNREFAPKPFTSFFFVPDPAPGAGGDHPVATYGVWPATRWAMTRDWEKHGSNKDIKSDFGALLLARNERGQTIKQALGGAQGISFKAVVSGSTRVIGYPRSGRFAHTDSPIGCGPRPIGRRAGGGGAGPNPLAIECSMTKGASGGPWLQDVNAQGIGTVISVTSAVSDQRPQMFGAVMDRANEDVYSSLARRKVAG